MDMPVQHGLWGLSEKEKQTLRLIVRGHDAKSVARALGLSVHTINERLRDARRKMGVPSSREAARLLLDAEGECAALPGPYSIGDRQIGEDAPHPSRDAEAAPMGGAGWVTRHPRFIAGAFLMTFIIGLLALMAMPDVTAPATQTATPPTRAATQDAQVVESARRWLDLVDAGRWEESYRATGDSFRKMNTAAVWADVSEKVRVPLGAVTSRTFVSQENLPAPPYGYEVVKFRTQFAGRDGAMETVTLDREDGGWRVVGYMID